MTGIIPAIKADKVLQPEIKKALIDIVKQLYKSGGAPEETGWV